MFTIPDLAATPTAEQTSQSGVDSVDFSILANQGGLGATGVVSGCAVTADGTDLVLTVASGTAITAIGGAQVTVAGNTVTATADPTNPRWALVCVNASGTATITMGAPAAPISATSPGPVFPAIPAGQLPLAVAYVSGGATALTAGDVVDKRVPSAGQAISGLTLGATSAPAAGYVLDLFGNVNMTQTDTQNTGTVVAMNISPSTTLGTSVTEYALVLVNAGPKMTANLPVLYGLYFAPTVLGAFTIAEFDALLANASTGAVGQTATLARGVYAQFNAGVGTITTGVGVDIACGGFAGSIGTSIGLRITALNKGTTVWGMQVGNYQSYHQGKIAFGSNTAPTYGIDLQALNAGNASVVGFAGTNTAPASNPPSNSAWEGLWKGTTNYYWVYAFNDGGTMRYTSIGPLQGTGTPTIAKGTALPA